MLNIQKYLQEHGREKLELELAVTGNDHPQLPLTIYHYNQINSPKTDPVCREARGIVLDKDHNLVSKTFDRFFNWGETSGWEKFNWENCMVTEKIDGSLCQIFNYQDEWLLTTRRTWGLDSIQGYNLTWQEGFFKALGITKKEELDNHLDKDLVYACEFVSPWNKVVRTYTNPAMYLLSISNKLLIDCKNFDQVLWQYNDCTIFAKPNIYEFHSIEDVRTCIQITSIMDPTFEGVVVHDGQTRWKIKSPTYLNLHALKSNDGFRVRNLLPLVLRGDDDILFYFEEAKDDYQELKAKIAEWKLDVDQVWDRVKEIELQKKYALAVRDHPLFPLLFDARKCNSKPSDLFVDYQDFILRRLENKC